MTETVAVSVFTVLLILGLTLLSAGWSSTLPTDPFHRHHTKMVTLGLVCVIVAVTVGLCAVLSM